MTGYLAASEHGKRRPRTNDRLLAQSGDVADGSGCSGAGAARNTHSCFLRLRIPASPALAWAARACAHRVVTPQRCCRFPGVLLEAVAAPDAHLYDVA
jgi:hypothetical protein